jgi:lipopolysaccharide/colanic/teichoic acid biosynthesis glycosyltransferase
MAKNAAMLKQKYLHLNEAPPPMFKIHNDPRFVGLGKWLAKTGFDELPQLWNILKGEMSFVGPRPLPVNEAENLPEEWRQWRERVRPGIFSQWAMSEKKHSTLDNWKNLEKRTMAKGSLFSDLSLLQKTVFSQLKNVIALAFSRREK